MTKILFAIVVVLASLFGGCSSTPTCRFERATLDVVRAATTEIAEIIPDDAGEEWQIALATTNEALDLGDQAVSLCENSPNGWIAWVSAVLRGVGELLDILKTAGISIPSWITMAVLALQSLVI